MTVTNTDQDAAGDGATVEEVDLHKLKYPDEEVGTVKAEDETSESEEDVSEEAEDTAGDESESADEPETEEDNQEEAPEDQPSFTKEFPNIKGDTPEEYIKNLEKAYGNSTSEAMRLKKLAEARLAIPEPEIGDDFDTDDSPASPAPAVTSDPTQLWISQQMDKEIVKAYDSFKSDYSQVEDPEMYEQFVAEVATFSQAKLAKGQIPDPSDLYHKAAVSLGWEKTSQPTAKEKLGSALKTNAASSPAKTSGAKPPVKSKVTDAQVAAYRQIARDGHSLSDAEIRKALEQNVT